MQHLKALLEYVPSEVAELLQTFTFRPAALDNEVLFPWVDVSRSDEGITVQLGMGYLSTFEPTGFNVDMVVEWDVGQDAVDLRCVEFSASHTFDDVSELIIFGQRRRNSSDWEVNERSSQGLERLLQAFESEDWSNFRMNDWSCEPPEEILYDDLLANFED